MAEGNLYDLSLATERGPGWQCPHGKTGFNWMRNWKGCWQCAFSSPGLWLQWRFPVLRRFGGLDLPPAEFVWFYAAAGLATFIFQIFLRIEQCTTFNACALTMAKALVWSAGWILYWPVYVAMATR
jgi:hypothetical protein